MLINKITFSDVTPIIIVFFSVIGLFLLFMLFAYLGQKYALKKSNNTNLDKNSLTRETKIYQLLYEKGKDVGLEINDIISNLDFSIDSDIILKDLNSMINKNIIEIENNKYKLKK